MDLEHALDEVLDAAKQPKQHPPGTRHIPLMSEVFAGAVDTHALRSRAWHNSLTPAQETVCRWIWETCGQHYETWERFEFAFLCEYNTNHELATWVRIAHVFDVFIKRYRSVDKELVIGELCRLSAGGRVVKLKGGRAKELTELWKHGATE